MVASRLVMAPTEVLLLLSQTVGGFRICCSPSLYSASLQERNTMCLTEDSVLCSLGSRFPCSSWSLPHCHDRHILITGSFLPLPEVHVEPHKKQLHVTLAYHFQASHLPTLEKLAQNIDVKLGCDWVATIFSRDIRFANHEVTSHCGPCHCRRHQV